MSAGPDEAHRLIEKIQSIRDRAIADKAAATNLYSFANPEHEARITAFSKYINVLNSLQLSFTFLSKHLLDKNWWNAVARAPIPDRDAQIYIDEFLNFTKLGFVHGVFSVIESSLRIFLRALDPAACNQGRAGFESVYKCLFNSKLTVPPTNGLELLDLLRAVRNTIHNNGVYFHPSGTEFASTWRGNPFRFTEGQPIEFVNWEALVDVVDDLRQVLREVIEDGSLRSIAVQIDDPFSHR